jgi:hypothetical protein
MDKLSRVWVEPVRPEQYPGFAGRKIKPTTREDLDNEFHTVAMRGFAYDKSPSEPPHKFRVIDFQQALDSYTIDRDFGRVIWPMWPFLFAENWREVIDELAKRKLYLFDIWAYCPSGPFERFEWSEYQVPDDVHKYILDKLGPRFLGYDNGEQDGRYIGGYAPLVCPAPATRRQGWEAFCQYFRQLGNDLQNYLVSLNSLTFPHYFAQMGNHRMLGAETAQGLPSVPMWYAFIRGAGKQYGLLWFGNASIWNRWGVKSLADPDAMDTNAPGYWVGPTSGTSLNLLKRLWYVLTMYGSVMMGYESGHFGKDNSLTAIGDLHFEAAGWCRDHPDRGELHTPVALLADFYTGWTPPRHLYTGDTYLAWGNMPYEKGDHQIDLLFRELYPGYEDASFYHSERGFLTPTPCGDSFDVILSDVPDEVLRRYECVVVSGETRIEDGLLEKLKGFVAQGGSVVACANQLGRDAGVLFGVELGDAEEAYHAIIPGHDWPINESTFRMRRLKCGTGTEVLAHTRQGAALVVRKRHAGGGETLLFSADSMLTNELVGRDKIRSDIDHPLLSPYAMLEHVKAVLLPYLREFGLIEVDGPPVQYLVNVTDRTDRLVVTLCNNSPEPWAGSVRPRTGRIKRAVNWMTGKPIRGGESVRVEVPPLDVVVIEMLAGGPLFEVKK